MDSKARQNRYPVTERRVSPAVMGFRFRMAKGVTSGTAPPDEPEDRSGPHLHGPLRHLPPRRGRPGHIPEDPFARNERQARPRPSRRQPLPLGSGGTTSECGDSGVVLCLFTIVVEMVPFAGALLGFAVPVWMIVGLALARPRVEPPGRFAPHRAIRLGERSSTFLQ